jgi:hypothetical protein
VYSGGVGFAPSGRSLDPSFMQECLAQNSQVALAWCAQPVRFAGESNMPPGKCALRMIGGIRFVARLLGTKHPGSLTPRAPVESTGTR